MRLIALGLLLVVLCGCVQPGEEIGTPAANETANKTNESGIANVTTNVTVNETTNETGGGAAGAGEVVGAVNETNATVNETTNATINETVNGSQWEEQPGILFGGGRYLLIIEDAVLYGDETCAAVAIAYANGTEIKRDVMCPLRDYYWTSPDGQGFRIKITKVAAGYGGETWAEAIIYG